MEKDFVKAINYTSKILNAWLPRKIQYDLIPGLSVGITYHGKLVYQKGFGYADIESKIPATEKTCYRIASISKTFTAISIMQLVEQGKIDPDDHVEKYLPWFHVRTKKTSSLNISIRQLLSHTGGVFRDSDTSHWIDDVFPDVSELKKSISHKTLVFKELTRFKYSSFGFALLGEIIKEVSGISYDQYVSKHIIEKLNMTRTAPDLSKESEQWLAQGYSRLIPGREREIFRHSETRAYAAATGFLSNVSDLALYIGALSLKQKEANALISKKSKKEIMKEHWVTGEDGKSYGLGFEIYKIGKRKIAGHGGLFAGFTTRISLDVENDIGVITLSNTNDSSSGLINTGIFETIYKLVDEKNKYTEDKKVLAQERYEGVYRSRWEDTVIVGVDAQLIAFDPKTNSPIKNSTLLKSNGKDTFVMETKSNFDSSGELATFIFEKNAEKAKNFVSASTPSERLEK